MSCFCTFKEIRLMLSMRDSKDSCWTDRSAGSICCCGTENRHVKGQDTLQMKGQSIIIESNINVWLPFMYSQQWNWYFQNRIIVFSLPVPTLLYLWEIYIFPGSVCLFCCREICGSILGIYKSLTDIWMWKLGLRQRCSQKRNIYI